MLIFPLFVIFFTLFIFNWHAKIVQIYGVPCDVSICNIQINVKKSMSTYHFFMVKTLKIMLSNFFLFKIMHAALSLSVVTLLRNRTPDLLFPNTYNLGSVSLPLPIPPTWWCLCLGEVGFGSCGGYGWSSCHGWHCIWVCNLCKERTPSRYGVFYGWLGLCWYRIPMVILKDFLTTWNWSALSDTGQVFTGNGSKLKDCQSCTVCLFQECLKAVDWSLDSWFCIHSFIYSIIRKERLFFFSLSF